MFSLWKIRSRTGKKTVVRRSRDFPTHSAPRESFATARSTDVVFSASAPANQLHRVVMTNQAANRVASFRFSRQFRQFVTWTIISPPAKRLMNARAQDMRGQSATATKTARLERRRTSVAGGRTGEEEVEDDRGRRVRVKSERVVGRGERKRKGGLAFTLRARRVASRRVESHRAKCKEKQ